MIPLTIAALLVLLCICLLVILRLCERPEPRVEAVRWVELPINISIPTRHRALVEARKKR